MNPPSELISAFRENRAAVFVGAGASMAAGLPSWADLISQLAQEFKLPLLHPLSAETMLQIPQYIVNASDSRRELMRCVKKLLETGRNRKTKPALLRPVHHYLAQLPSKLYYTTNFDTCLEDEFDEQGIRFDVVDSEVMASQFSERTRCQIRKIHGSIKGNWEDIVLTRSDYACVTRDRPTLFQALAEDLKSHVFLFVGYSLRDPDFGSIYNSVFLTMRGKHQTHFLALIDDPGSHEIVDLGRRGLVPVKIWDYPGSDGPEKLRSFLASLVDATSEQFHLRRFYRGLDRGDHIPIVITSQMHEKDHYVFYPACDIHAVNQIKEDLQKIGVTTALLPDHVALKDRERYLSDNVILVCSPLANRFTKYVFDRAATIESSTWPHFEQSGNQKCFVMADDRQFVSDDPILDGAGERSDHGIIARYRNPWEQGKYIFLFAGLQAAGTQAVGEFIKKPEGYRKLNETGDAEELVLILRVVYSEHDPYNYQIEVRAVTHLLT